MKTTVNLHYGWQETEDGTYHAFEATDPYDKIDPEAMGKTLAEALDTTPDDPRFNWNSMEIAIPEHLAVCSRLNDQVIVDPVLVGKWRLRLVGTDYCEDKVYDDRDAAVAALKEMYQKVIDDHDGGSWFEEQTLDETLGEFTIYAEEFYQEGAVLPVNAYKGTLHDVQEISELADEAASFAMCYQYELQDMSAVFDNTCEIKGLCEKIKDDLKKQIRSSSKSYVDLLGDLTRTIMGDQCMPQNEREKALNLIEFLQDILWKYSD